MCGSNRCATGPALSLYDAAIQEADRHKWLVSERHGRDCGYPAWSEWWDRHWPYFCRHRRIEHLRGDCRWREFEDEAYGRFYDLVLQGDPLVNAILDRVAKGWENLHFALWLNECEYSRDRVIEILTAVNINTAARMKPWQA